MAMRVSLKELIQSSIVLQYHLPHDIADKHISCSCISTEKDYCLHQNGTNIDIANIIYNGIVEYAYSDNEIDLTQLDKLQIRALLSKLKFDPSASESIQLGYGFQGEVMLHLLLSHFFHAEKALARGYLYSALENAETKGYDSYLMVEDNQTIFLLFGEAKFYLDGYKKSLDSIFDNINKTLSDSYFNRNFIAMENHYEHIEPKSRIRQIIDQWRADPLINMAKEASRHNMHLVYPMLVIFDDKMTVYDDLIMGIISYIQTKYSAVQPTLTIPYTIFFLFFHVDNSRIIKTQVLQWINQKQRRLSFEYIVFKGVNDSLIYAKELVKLLRGLDCRMNLIRFHAIPNVDLEGADMESMIAFRDYLTQHGLFATIRASRGEDIFAACGMLSTAQQQAEKKEKESETI